MLTREQQEDLVHAFVWATHHPCADVRERRQLVCDFYQQQVGRCVVMSEVEPFARNDKAKRKRKTRGLRVFQRGRTTSARTLNCDFPTALHAPP